MKTTTKRHVKDNLDADKETKKVMMRLCWLVGGQYVGQCRQTGVSKPSAFKAAFQQK
jgi:hypothetical protein